MRDLASPTMAPEPQPPSLPLAMPPSFKLPMLYYGLAVVGTGAVILLLYNLIIIKWCENVGIEQRQGGRQRRGRARAGFVEGRSGRSLENSQLCSFNYRKKEAGDEAEPAKGRSSDYECAVCLSVFEEGEEVRRLPRCNHSFHAACIDTWLYSHCDCPLCRAPVVEPLFHPQHPEEHTNEHSREGLIASV